MDTQTTLDLLATVRHEWMNRLQVISLYASMEPKRLDELYARYRQQADLEGALCRLDRPKTALLLIRANWEKRLEYAVEATSVPIADDVLEARLSQLLASTDQTIHVTFTDGVMIRIDGNIPEGVFADHEVLEETKDFSLCQIKEGK